jgi:hypothetical protein
MLQLQFDPGSIPDASTCATNVAMAGSAGGLTAGGAEAGTAAGAVGVVVGGGAAGACVVVVVTGVGKAAGTTAGEMFSVVAVTAWCILSWTLPAASTARTAAVPVGRAAEAPSGRAPPDVLMATAPEARAIAAIPTIAPRFRSDPRPVPEDVAEGDWFVPGSTMC